MTKLIGISYSKNRTKPTAYFLSTGKYKYVHSRMHNVLVTKKFKWDLGECRQIQGVVKMS